MSTNNVKKLSLSGDRSRESGRRLAQARKSAELNQGEVAKMLGKKDRTSISNWETGKSSPSIEELVFLSVKYKKSPGWLMALDVFQKDLNMSDPDVQEVNEELDEIEYSVDDIVNRRLPQGANLEVLRSSVQLIQSFLEAFEGKRSSD